MILMNNAVDVAGYIAVVSESKNIILLLLQSVLYHLFVLHVVVLEIVFFAIGFEFCREIRR